MTTRKYNCGPGSRSMTSERKLYVCTCGKKEWNSGDYVVCLGCGKVTVRQQLKEAV